MHDIAKVLFRVFCIFDGEFRAPDELDDSSLDFATVNDRVLRAPMRCHCSTIKRTSKVLYSFQ